MASRYKSIKHLSSLAGRLQVTWPIPSSNIKYSSKKPAFVLATQLVIYGLFEMGDVKLLKEDFPGIHQYLLPFRSVFFLRFRENTVPTTLSFSEQDLPSCHVESLVETWWGQTWFITWWNYHNLHENRNNFERRTLSFQYFRIFSVLVEERLLQSGHKMVWSLLGPPYLTA